MNQGIRNVLLINPSLHSGCVCLNGELLRTPEFQEKRPRTLKLSVLNSNIFYVSFTTCAYHKILNVFK